MFAQMFALMSLVGNIVILVSLVLVVRNMCRN
jgi:hypothetical protein